MFTLLRALHDDVVSKTVCRRSEEGGGRLGIGRIGQLAAGLSVGPPGLEPGTCRSRVRSQGAGKRPACALFCSSSSLWYRSFRLVSRSSTGMRRGRLSGWRLSLRSRKAGGRPQKPWLLCNASRLQAPGRAPGWRDEGRRHESARLVISGVPRMAVRGHDGRVREGA